MLSRRLAPTARRDERWSSGTAAVRRFSHARVDGVALFAEPAAGQAFRYLAYCGFDGQVARYEV